ncbi:ATP-dependent RecD-like DNA helicase [Microvirga tunisiensis]|uniref:ATP-dependent RecD2 DNA helicase n=1 Tax=Microvirga tunisiensis TaxID=2108360 RepID=A0A5N7MTS4_9HYPH|nr:ATP-dependent RecD-like DNA helicase [Microvirga tunisiensis]MPR12348.1 ATP-dependent RecD-like DNA helicase [Microvirga tunisiensis]MPR30278.1 ATP-dependent RecD-like DNA helicase [Microvirga tunisiensis]
MNQMLRPPQADQRPVLETLAGSVERVTFHNTDSGFAVLKVHTRGKRDLVTVVGHTPAVSAGEWITASGLWISDRTHGLQFKAEVLKTTPPTGVEGIEKYLASGQMRGIGPAMAKRIVAAFGVDTFEIIEASPERLTEVSGIGPMRASRIVSGWAEQKAVREIMIFLHAHGVGTARAVRIFKTYGYESIQVMTEDPYRLAKDVRGIGFKTADAIAAKLGMEKTAPQRIRAGISFALQTATDEGHCALPVEALTRLAVQLLEVDADLIRTAIVDELSKGEVVSDTIGGETCLFLKGLHLSEQAIASRLAERASGPPPWPEIDLERAVPWVEGRTGKTLAASQREALKLVLGSKVAVVTGGPGVGKTTLLDTILRLLVAKGVKVLLTAPTGRAAKRMTEQTGLEAKTIHRLLEIDPKHGGFSRNEENPLDCDLLVVDETSMVDVPLMNALTKAIPSRAGLLLVGDVDQLPSVGPGQILADIIGSERIPVARLTEVFRQAAESRIVVNAHRINHGQMPDPPKAGEESDFYFIGIDEPEQGVGKIIEMVKERMPKRFGLDPLKDIQVLCPMNRGVLGARNLNIELQRVLNPNPPATVERFGWRFSPGDRVMETQNDYDREVFNGDLGMVVRIDDEEGALIASFDGREVSYPFGELDTLVPAYATTIHKSQGSEYPAVIIPVVTQHYTMLARNLLYTGVTRGKRLVVLVGQKKAVAMAVRGGNMKRRWTKLREWLAAS